MRDANSYISDRMCIMFCNTKIVDILMGVWWGVGGILWEINIHI